MSGVTLKSKQKRMMLNNEYAYALELTFSGVGETPDNKYIIYVDTYDYKVRQWDFFPTPTMKDLHLALLGIITYSMGTLN